MRNLPGGRPAVRYDIEVEVYGVEAESSAAAGEKVLQAVRPYGVDAYVQNAMEVEDE